MYTIVGKLKDKQINVGVDVWNFEPVSLEAIEQIIKNGPVACAADEGTQSGTQAISHFKESNIFPIQRRLHNMKTDCFRALLAAGAISALMLGMPALSLTAARADELPAQSAQPAALPADLKQLLDSLPAKTADVLKKLAPRKQAETLRVIQLIGSINQTLSNPHEFIKSLSPKAQAAMKKLSPSERAKAMPLIRQSIKQTLTRDDVQELAAMPDSKKENRC